jgi:hypothetical protein
MVGEQKETDLPHIRWIGVGIPSRDPFDAAGNHSLESRDNMMSEATLSRVRLPYIPNIRSLSYSRKGRPREYLNQKPDSRVFLVTMEDITRDMSLHSVGDEKKSIQDLRTCISIHTTTLSSTTSTEVLGQSQS